MTPIETLQHFNKRWGKRKEAYKAMQKNYIQGNVKKGLFCDRGFVEGLLKEHPSELLGSYKSDIHNAWKTIDKKIGLSEEEVEEKRIQAMLGHDSRVSRELAIGTQLFGTWRNSLGIYRISDDIADQALASPIPDDTPTIIYAQLPEWAVYMEMPIGSDIEVMAILDNGDGESVTKMLKVIGFWAMHDKHDLDKSDVGVEADQNLSLHIFLHIDIPKEFEKSNYIGPPLVLPLRSNLTVAQSVAEEYDHNSDNETVVVREVFGIILSLLLWLCVDEPDVSDVTGAPMSSDDLKAPKYKRSKRADVFIPPQNAQIYDIGKKLAYETREHNKKLALESGVTGKKVKPHIRKGHWHGVWSGTGENKVFSTYWQSPIFINAK